MPADNGDTPIKTATEHANLLVLDELLMSHKLLGDKGNVKPEHADINCQGADGLTPLHVASRSAGLIGCLLVRKYRLLFIRRLECEVDGSGKKHHTQLPIFKNHHIIVNVCDRNKLL